MTSSKKRLVAILAGGVTLVALAAGAYLIGRQRDRLPAPGSEVYEEMTRRFYRGLASLQVGLLDDAKREFTGVTELVPGEPAAWANLALAHLRLAESDAAAQALEQAARLTPENVDILLLQGQMESARGRLDEGIAYLRRAVELDPSHLRARFMLAQEVERAGAQDADTQAQDLLDDLLQRQPDNLAILLERTRLAAKRSDETRLLDSLDRLGRNQTGWSSAALEQYRGLQQAVGARTFADAARAVAFLRNVLAPVPAFRESLALVRTPSESIGEPLERFIRLPSPSVTPSPADVALTFVRESFGGERSTAWSTLLAVSLNGIDSPATFAADGGEVRRIDVESPSLPLPRRVPAASAATSALTALDWNQDFKLDVAVTGPSGVRLFVQGDDGTFADVTARAATGAAAVNADSFGAWPADVEMDGDLDLVVGVRNAAPIVLRNNGDGTWRLSQPFPGATDLRDFAWGDLDRDGDPDAAILDGEGNVHLFINRQAGDFRSIDPAPALHKAIALAAGDANADGVLDLVTLDAGGQVWRISANRDGWNEQPMTAWPGWSGGSSPGMFRLWLADVDNNGALDLIGSGLGDRSRLWLADEQNGFRPLPAVPDAEIFSVGDLDNNGQLDLIGLSAGRPVRFMGRGTRSYHWQVIRPRAQAAPGDQRINSFGIGGDIEIRSGLLTQKQTINGTLVHFGLGSRTSIEVARIVWPNGVVQAEFDRNADQVIVAEQRLKGSCPWVFTYDGAGMRFVTDFLWRSPLGLRINAQDTASITQTEDWVKVRGDQLAPRDGAYDIRITAELWETHFIDYLSLMVVDHPADTEVFIDERFAAAAPALALHATRTPRPVGRAWDETGRDVTDLIARQDGRYLATFEPGEYQGIARDHFVELEIGEEIPQDQPFWLIAHGWVYPTDSSINVAIGQGRHVQPRGLVLEAQDDAGRWVVVSPDLGFPAGKNKTILIDLRSVATAGLPHARRLRLGTNLEVYWDRLAYAAGVDSAALRTTRLQATRAELRYRGFSQTDHAAREVPETPSYDRIASVSQRWRDLVGYHTRFGDTLELLAGVDDRYVIMNAGDELQTLFPAPALPEAGWARDFVLIGDGWEKDGDYNTSYSKTVQPLPSHGRPRYEASSETLELTDDPVYQRHAEDWRNYHTRFVAPRDYLRGLKLE